MKKYDFITPSFKAYKKLSCILALFFSISSLLAQNSPEQFKLTKDFIIGKTDRELRLMRNEIFARYGYEFSSPDLKNHFSQKLWYKPKSDNINAKLTQIDKHNIGLIKQYEQAKKEREIKYSDTLGNLIKQRISVSTNEEKSHTFDVHREISIDTIYDWTIKKDLNHHGTEESYNIFTIESVIRPIIRTKYVRDVILYKDFYITTPREINISEADINELYVAGRKESVFSFNRNIKEIEGASGDKMFLGFSNANWRARKDEFYLGTLFCYLSTGQLYQLEVFAETKDEYYKYDTHIASSIEIKDKVLPDTHSKYVKSLTVKNLGNLDVIIQIKPPHMNEKEFTIPIKDGLINGKNETHQIFKI